MTKLISKPNYKLSKSNALILSFGIPAEKTCSKAQGCKEFCFGLKGAYRYPNVDKAFKWRFEQSKQESFVTEFRTEMDRKRKKPDYFRVHDIGDYYSDKYVMKWFEIMESYPEIQFYSYTKEIGRMKKFRDWYPENFTIIFSYGGKEDHLIDPDEDRHSFVFNDLEALERNGYTDATNDDLIAGFGDNHRIGLIKH